MHLVMGVPLRVATATSNLMIGITASASAIVYLLRGGIDAYVAGPTAVGVFVGASIGSRLAHRVESAILRLLFVLVLVYTAFEMARRAACAMSDDRWTRGTARLEPAARSRAPGGTYVSIGAGGGRLVLLVAGACRRSTGGPRSTSRASSPDIVALRPAGFLWLGILGIVATPGAAGRLPRSSASGGAASARWRSSPS